MKIILSHPTGNANVRAVAQGLNEAEMLSGFYTAIASFPGDWLDRVSGIGALAEIKRRQFHPALQAHTKFYPWFETGRLLASKLHLSKLTRHEQGMFSVDAVYRQHDKWVARNLKSQAGNTAYTAVYAYEDGARYSFNEAKRLNIPCYYDLPIGYWRTARRLLKQEIEKWPEWASTLTGFKDSDTKLGYKDEELQLADHIFVASSFTAKTLADFNGRLAPVTVIPYGFPAVEPRSDYNSNGKLRVLFVGGLSQRKGIANLFAAAGELADFVDLTVVGRKASNDCAALDNALNKHKWIPSLPHANILKLMRTQDVLVFPSLFEGFGLVITEAMSQGLTVITTDRTAGPDLITNGENGLLIEAGSTQAITQALENLINDRQRIRLMGRAAQETASKRTWHVYGQELARAIAALNRK
ncbi:glycosyltransferase family 4 protein [Mucilaginibacter sp. PAMB04274]|uniref:glycosyltransferase family 4 protein n=1 Tax=Mucilaginibacter sp. PAMB04274 TaxID=3138568 RepID=UPI0031F6F7A2